MRSQGIGAQEWEVDFCSRPLKDERGKRVWEVLVTDPSRSFEFSEYLPNSRINSGELARSIQRAADSSGAELPKRAKFFRPQMQTIISRALAKLASSLRPAVAASHSCLGSRNARSTFTPTNMATTPPSRLLLASTPKRPNASPTRFAANPGTSLLSLSEVLEECAAVRDGSRFGALIDVDSLSLNVSSDTLIPGVCVYTRRSKALAGWMSSLELANVAINLQYGQLLLETGVSDVWQYATYKANEANTEQAQAWLQAKEEACGLHFLAVQPSEESEAADGFWLCRDFEPSV